MLVLAMVIHRQFDSTLSKSIAIAFVTSGLAFMLAFAAFPAQRGRFLRAFEQLTFPLRWIATTLVLALLYYFVVVPIGIWFRFSGRSMRQVDPSATTGWEPLEATQDDESYFRMF